jgi:uncharacterized SAM-binding protein YcdF (DUF218 family)
MPIFWAMMIIILLNQKKYYYIFIKITFLIMLILSLPILINIINYPLSLGADKYKEGDNISAVIVLTGGAYKDLNNNWYPSINTINRSVLGNNIAKKLNVPLIIIGGNKNSNAPSESTLASQIIKNDNLILELESKNTYQSVVNLKEILLKNNLETKGNYLIVTSKIHHLRTALTFKSKNYRVKVFGYKNNIKLSILNIIPNSQSYLYFNKGLYEYLGIVQYILNGYIRINVFN